MPAFSCNNKSSWLVPQLVLLALVGCTNQQEVTYKSGGMTHIIAEGKDAVPKDFPVPLYPGATTTGSVSAQGDQNEQSKFLMLSTPASVDQVGEFYKQQLPATGWQIDKMQAQAPSGNLVSISAHRKNLEVQVMAADDSGKTTISVSVGEAGEITKEDTDNSNNDNFKPDKVTPPTD